MLEKFLFLISLCFKLSLQQKQFKCYNESMYAKSSNNLILESNENSLDKIKSIDFDLFYPTFSLQAFSKGQIYQIVIMNSFDLKEEYAFCICQLLKQISQNYYISCIDGIHIDLQKKQTYQNRNAKQFNIVFSNQNGESCEQMYHDHQNLITVLCHSLQDFKVYQINLRTRKSILLGTGNNSLKQVCSAKFLFHQKQFLLIFSNCEEWQIYEIQEEGLLLFLNQQILSQNGYSFIIEQLNHVFNCQQNLYLVDSNNYYQLLKNGRDFLIQQNFTSTHKILLLTFNSQCNPWYIFSTMKNSSIFQIFKIQQGLSEILIPSDPNQTEVFYTSQYLILKNNESLKLMINQDLYQEIKLLRTKLHHLDIRYEENQVITDFIDLYFQIDDSGSFVHFYKFLKFRQMLKPTKKYVYDIEVQHLFSKFNVLLIYEVIIKDLKFYLNFLLEHPIKVEVENGCQRSQLVNVRKDYEAFQRFHQLQINSNVNNYLKSISDEIDTDVCPELDSSTISQIVWVSWSYDAFFAIVAENIFIIYDCRKQEIKFKMNVQNQTVMSYEKTIFIAQLNSKLYHLINFINYQWNHLSNFFQEELLKVKQFENQIFLQFYDSIQILNLQTLGFIQLEQVYFKHGIPIFYSNSAVVYTLLQYQNFIFIKFKTFNTIHQVELKDVQIIKVNYQRHLIFMRVVHNIQNKLLSYLYDGERLICDNEIILEDFYLVRPIQTRESLFTNVIAANQIDGRKVFIFIQIDKAFFLNKITITKKFCFFFYNQQFFYFNEYGKMKSINFQFYSFKFLIPTLQLNHKDQSIQFFNIIFFNQNETVQTKGQLQLSIFNQCFMIQNINKQILQFTSKSLIIFLPVLSMFQGPIENLSIQKPDIAVVNGPIVLEEKVIQCNTQNSNLCLVSILLQFSNQEILKLYCLFDKQNQNDNLESCQEINLQSFSEILYFFHLRDISMFVVFIGNFQEQIDLLTFTKDSSLGSFIQSQQILLSITKQTLIPTKESLFIKSYKHFFFVISNNILKIIQIDSDKNQFIEIQGNFIDVFALNNSENTFIFLEFQYNSICVFIFNLIKLQFPNIKSLKYFQLGQNDLIVLLQEYFPQQHNLKIDHFAIQSIFFCSIVENLIIVNFLVILNELTFQIELKFELNTAFESISVMKIIRNPIKEGIFLEEYIDQQYIILKQFRTDTHQYFLYDLREERLLYDYIHKFENQIKIIKQYNNTHYILREIATQIIYIGRIGYQLQLKQNLDDEVQILVNALNMISNTTIEIKISKSEKIDFYEYWSYCATFLVILIIGFMLYYFLIRRNKLIFKKNKKKQNAAQNVQGGLEL